MATRIFPREYILPYFGIVKGIGEPPGIKSKILKKVLAQWPKRLHRQLPFADSFLHIKKMLFIQEYFGMDVVKEVSDVNEVHEVIGNFGMYQIALLVPLWLAVLPPTIQEFITIFLTLTPGWQCVSHNSSTCNTTGLADGSGELEKYRCDMPRSEWRYTEAHQYSIVTEFDLSCTRENLIYASTSVYFIGYALGSLALGYVSDRYGRMLVIILSSSAVLIFTLANAYVPSYAGYLAIRIIIGFFVPGTYVTMVVMATEMVGERYRPIAGTTIWFFFSAAQILLAVKATHVREWRKLLIICSAPYFFVLPVLWLVPESFAWLHSVGKFDKALLAIRRIAKWNRKKIPTIKFIEADHEHFSEQTNKSPLQLFGSWRVALRTTALALAWLVISLDYYGVSLAVENLTGDTYRDFLVLAVVEFPAAVATIVATSRYGRKRAVLIPLLICGVAFIALAFIPSSTSARKEWLAIRLTLGVLGKLVSAISFNSMYVWCAELYPTHLRQVAAGMFNSCAYIGNICAPWVAQWSGNIHRVVPFLLMGSLAVLSSWSLTKLPETKGQKLPERFENLDGSALAPRTQDYSESNLEMQASPTHVQNSRDG